MFRLLKAILRGARRHWGKLLVVAVLSGLGTAVYAMSEWRSRALEIARPALEWAGFTQEVQKSDKIYYCPMDPQIERSDPNDICPICNMALVLKEKGRGSDAGPPGELILTPQQVQQAGTASEAVIRRRLYREIDTTGRIDYDERRLTTISDWIRGKSRIQKLHVNYKGIQVHQGDVLAELYSPDLIVAQEEYLSALRSNAEGSRSRLRTTLIDAARQRLVDQGMTPAQIEELESSRQVSRTIPVYAKSGGTVHRRHVQEGQYVMEGDKLFELCDLDQMWVFADIFEEEVTEDVSLGMKVAISVESLPEETFEGTVSFIDYMVKPGTRTVPVRIVVDNPDHTLKAGMFARVRFRHEWPNALAVPENAVIWTGQRAVVLVRQSGGTFQPREVRLGARWLYEIRDPAGVSRALSDGSGLEFGSARRRYHQVLAGLTPGEQVVTSGAFLINAEAQSQNVLVKMLPPEDRPASLEDAIGEPLAGGIRDVLDAYFKLTTSLTDDDLAALAGRGERLSEAATRLATLAADAGPAELQKAAAAVAKYAAELGGDGPADLHAARIVYGRISREMFVLLSQNGGQTLLGKDVFAYHCGMAKVGFEDWLWWSPEIHNPYMGQKMLRCGKMLDSLQP